MSRHVINRQDRVKANRLLAEQSDNYFTVESHANGGWAIRGWAKVPGETPKDIHINDEQFRMMVFYKIIDIDMLIFDQRRFKVVNQNLKFQALYNEAIDSLEKTGRFPDGKLPHQANQSLEDALL